LILEDISESSLAAQSDLGAARLSSEIAARRSVNSTLSRAAI
jgi:hypothetical protein